ncbi:competence type IV pilus minor pilin ComGD [Staphylococcus pasteuri]|uniref:competence type IV pilus minor pilin ComGD n=1 Tax=Staphylococcus TaxID=1279 RepID=UPI0009F1AE37|nr:MULTISPECIES: competence type IV pilus minor pilin ComGD [Staphylococcus]RQX29140.1 hypothetical protein DB792_00695 [Staphylococcus warneri]UXR66304.1 hypothetical protein MUA61_06150 [Staphylococcus pasteuri]
MAKRLQIKYLASFTYLEMLMVMFILAILTACTLIGKTLLSVSASNDELNINHLITQMNYLKSKAINDKQSISLIFTNQTNSIKVKEEHGSKYQLKIKGGKIVNIAKIQLLTFNKDGHINNFGSINLKMKHGNYKLIFHIEKGRIRYIKI